MIILNRLFLLTLYENINDQIPKIFVINLLIPTLARPNNKVLVKPLGQLYETADGGLMLA